MTAIAWSPVKYDAQVGTCADGTITIQAPDDGGRVRVALRPPMPEGLSIAALMDQITASTGTPAFTRLMALNPMGDGAVIAYFHDRDAARAHLDQLFTNAIAGDTSLDTVLIAAGFVKQSEHRFVRQVGTSAFEVSLHSTNMTLRVYRVRNPTRWTTLATLYWSDPRDQTPGSDTGLWPVRFANRIAFAQTIVAVSDAAIASGLLGAKRRASRRAA